MAKATDNKVVIEETVTVKLSQNVKVEIKGEVHYLDAEQVVDIPVELLEEFSRANAIAEIL